MSGNELYDDRMIRHILLTPGDMRRVEDYAADQGTSSSELMDRAGLGVAELVCDAIDHSHLFQEEIVVLCGPGQNGGDGFVTAWWLREWGYRVSVMLLADKSKLTGSARTKAKKWAGPFDVIDLARIRSAGVIVDALFGAGLSRGLEGEAALVVEAANKSEALKVAVDLPSGVIGATGQIPGACFEADFTVTFFLLKPGHIAAPGRFFCGGIKGTIVTDIGLIPDHLAAIDPKIFHNTPDMWGADYPYNGPQAHKYTRGHILVLGGQEPTLGASRLASLAALRAGAGLVTLAAPGETYSVQAAALTDVLVKRFENDVGFMGMVKDSRVKAVLLGPGSGLGDRTSKLVQGVLGQKTRAVLDADALNSLIGRVELLHTDGTYFHTLTPHMGEFARLFPDLYSDFEKNGDYIGSAVAAANRTQSVMVLKGTSTIVASPDGRVSISSNAPSYLSVAGTGDVLAGMIAALIGKGMPEFEAASAAVWMHGEAATRAGKGMIASDLLSKIPHVLP